MNPSILSLVSTILFSLAALVVGQKSDNQTGPPSISFRPSIAVVIGIFTIMFSLTFLLLIYVKFCRSAASEIFNRNPSLRDPFQQPPPDRCFSGIDKTVIESLPFFRFTSLRGSRKGLECAVCLTKFDDADTLRLLPKCKHAFHISCVDRWLESHSTCPLCRHRIDPRDVTLFKCSSSSRFLFSDRRTDEEIRDLELFVERETDDNRHSSRKLILDNSMDELIPITNDHCDREFLHKFKHRIIVSDVVFRSRWSDVNSSDLVTLNYSDMLDLVSSKRFSATASLQSDVQKPNSSIDHDGVVRIKEEMEKKRLLETKASEINRHHNLVGFPLNYATTTSDSRSLMSPGNRCMSEITNMSRFRTAVKDSTSNCGGGGGADENVRRIWLPIARRTVQWFAGRERRSELRHDSRELDNV